MKKGLFCNTISKTEVRFGRDARICESPLFSPYGAERSSTVTLVYLENTRFVDFRW